MQSFGKYYGVYFSIFSDIYVSEQANSRLVLLIEVLLIKTACIRKTESPMKAVTVDIFRECIAKFLDTFRHVSLNALFFLEDEKDEFSWDFHINTHSRMRIVTESVFSNLVTRS